MGEAFVSICSLIICSNKPFSTKVGFQIAHTMSHFGYPLSTENTLLDIELQGEISLIAYEVFQNPL